MRRSPASNPLFLIIAAAFALLSWLPPLSNTTLAATPRLNLKPSHGLPGETILASGRNFAPGATGTLTLLDDGSQLATFETASDGDF